jgi:hypothetical protein
MFIHHFASIRKAFLLALTAASALYGRPEVVSAQGHPYGTLAVGTAYGYDGNLLSATNGPGVVSDVFTRIGPVVEGGYAWNLTRIGGRYSFDADRYRQYGALNRLFAQEDAGAEIRLVATRRFRISGDASYFATETAGDLNLDTLLLTGRRPATRLTAMSSAFYDLSPMLALVAGYSYTRDTLVGGVGSDTETSRIGLDRRTTPRDTVGVSYELRRVRFSDTFAERGRDMFHVVHGRWTHAFTPATRLELEGGPHFDGQRVRPELFAVLRHEGRRGDVSVGYSRELTTTLGEIGLVDVHRIAGGGTFRPVPRLRLTALPAMAYNRHERRSLGEAIVPVYTLDAEAAIQAASRLTFVFSARLGRQDGALPGPIDTIVEKRFTAQAVVTLVKTARVPGEWPHVLERDE